MKLKAVRDTTEVAGSYKSSRATSDRGAESLGWELGMMVVTEGEAEEEEVMSFAAGAKNQKFQRTVT